MVGIMKSGIMKTHVSKENLKRMKFCVQNIIDNWISLTLENTP